MDENTVVTQDEWLEARKALLAKEKEFTQAREALARKRRELPWVRIDKAYAFDGPGGKSPLADLFADHSQLIVCHFMYGPDWTEGCPSCSFWADGYDPMVVHLAARDTAFVAVSRTSLANIDAYKKRMGWHFNWVSSLDNDFNQDFAVSFTKAQMESGAVPYNYATAAFPSEEGPGLSVFCKNANGEIFHTYSCYARGLDMMNTAYHLLDLTPKGRDEDALPFTMAWVRRHDQYGKD